MYSRTSAKKGQAAGRRRHRALGWEDARGADGADSDGGRWCVHVRVGKGAGRGGRDLSIVAYKACRSASISVRTITAPVNCKPFIRGFIPRSIPPPPPMCPLRFSLPHVALLTNRWRYPWQSCACRIVTVLQTRLEISGDSRAWASSMLAQRPYVPHAVTTTKITTQLATESEPTHPSHQPFPPGPRRSSCSPRPVLSGESVSPLGPGCAPCPFQVCYVSSTTPPTPNYNTRHDKMRPEQDTTHILNQNGGA